MIPCGIRGKTVTSLARERGTLVRMEDVEEALARRLAVDLGLRLVEGTAGIIGPAGAREQ